MVQTPTVALRKESVDRNAYGRINDISRLVALRKESVDRNDIAALTAQLPLVSLSARRAWIEISRAPRICRSAGVALRKESVDRNRYFQVVE